MAKQMIGEVGFINGTNGADLILSGEGDSIVSAGNGNDVIVGGNGNDMLDGGNGQDTLFGGAGNDSIVGGTGTDMIYGGSGNDTIGLLVNGLPVNDNGADLIYGDGRESNLSLVLTVATGNDTIYGGNGVDIIYGDNGNNADAGGDDLIYSGNGDDQVWGEGGNDRISGGLGADRISGGAGADVFVYGEAAESTVAAMDIISDFTGLRDGGGDRIDLSALLGKDDLAWSGMTPTANSVWYTQSGGNTYVYADINGNPATPELAIKLLGLHDLTNNDFAGLSNNAPINSFNNNVAKIVVQEDSSISFNAINGNALQVTDGDFGAMLTVTLNATNGALTLSNTDGVALIDGDGSNGSVSFTGSVAAVNAVLAVGVVFTPAANYHGDAVIEMLSSDGISSDSDTLALSVLNVDDEATARLSVSGAAAEGGSLTAALLSVSDVDGMTTTAYQWQHKVDGNWINLDGQTNATLAIATDQSMVGEQVRVVATTTDEFGGTTDFEGDLQTVANVNDDPTGSVTISGIAAEDQTLTASNDLVDEDGLGSISYRWYADGNDTGITGDSYTLAQADVGKVFTVKASYTDAYDTDESVTSASMAAVANVNDDPTGSVTISGIAAEDQTLTASNDLVDEDGLGSISYRWYADGNDTGVTGDSYTLAQADVGKVFTVKASYTDAYDTDESVTSISTAAVENVDDEAVGTLSVTGIANEGGSLIAALSAVSDADGATTTNYQWQQYIGDNWTNLAGQNSATLVIASDESMVGAQVRVVATTTDILGGNTDFVGDTLTVENVNDAPVFTSSATIGRVSEHLINSNNSGFTSKIVGSVSASDGSGGALSYSIVSDSSGGAFKIDASTGMVTVRDISLLDYEASVGLVSDGDAKYYALSVKVSNGVDVALQDARIYLTDVESISTSNGANYVEGGNGNDAFNLDNGSDVAFGDGGNDILNGQNQMDWIFGGSGNDLLTGGNDVDILYGGAGVDTMSGGNGADTFVFGDGWSTGIDTVTDFTHASDKLLLANDYAGLFSTLSSGTLAASQFASGDGLTTASTAAIHVIYDSATGALYYDADGAGGNSAVQFATLQGHPGLTTNDIVVGVPPGP